jgi:hypothetical protein
MSMLALIALVSGVTSVSYEALITSTARVSGLSRESLIAPTSCITRESSGTAFSACSRVTTFSLLGQTYVGTDVSSDSNAKITNVATAFTLAIFDIFDLFVLVDEGCFIYILIHQNLRDTSFETINSILHAGTTVVVGLHVDFFNASGNLGDAVGNDIELFLHALTNGVINLGKNLGYGYVNGILNTSIYLRVFGVSSLLSTTFLERQGSFNATKYGTHNNYYVTEVVPIKITMVKESHGRLCLRFALGVTFTGVLRRP